MLGTTLVLLFIAQPQAGVSLTAPALPGVVALLQDDQAANAAAAGLPSGAPLQAEQPLGDPFPAGLPVDWLGALGDNMLASVDLSVRFAWDSGTESWATSQFYGFDIYKVFSGDRGDIGTMVLQGFASRIDGASRPYFFDPDNEWEFVYRMFFMNWRLDPRGALNLKTGHFEMPFGLEAMIDTNGTLRQMGTPRNLGIKADWGATLNGVSNGLEYEVGVGRGSGNGWHSSGDPYLFVGRVGTIREADSWVGVSGFVGDLWRPGGVQVRRRRIGIDAGVHKGPWSFMAELSGGTNNGDAAVNTLLELDWHAPADEWLLYGQFMAWTQRVDGWDDNLQLVLGCQWAFDKHTVLSLQYVQNLTMFNDTERTGELQLQMRYRF